MSTVIKIKRSPGTAGPGNLANGELAYVHGSGTQGNGGYRLYVGAGAETNGNADHIDIVGGKYFTDLLDHPHGTLTASSAVILDSNSKIDIWNVDDIIINDNTISSAQSNQDINISPSGTGVVNVNTSKITNVIDPTGAQDAATKNYVDTVAIAQNELSELTDVNLTSPVDGSVLLYDATPAEWVDSLIIDGGTY